jgi:hypothetical protein
MTQPILDMITALCVNQNSIYKTIEGIDAWDLERDAYNFDGLNPIIAHPPCQQWSRLKAFAKVNPKEKDLAIFCLEKINRNGGILEHPAGSTFFKYAGIKPTISIDQHWFGFPARKRTYLYFVGCKPLSFPLNFDLSRSKVQLLHSSKRSDTTIFFAKWLINSIVEGGLLRPPH